MTSRAFWEDFRKEERKGKEKKGRKGEESRKYIKHLLFVNLANYLNESTLNV